MSSVTLQLVDLPAEVAVVYASLLEPKELCRLAQVSKQLRDVANAVWMKLEKEYDTLDRRTLVAKAYFKIYITPSVVTCYSSDYNDIECKVAEEMALHEEVKINTATVLRNMLISTKSLHFQNWQAAILMSVGNLLFTNRMIKSRSRRQNL